MDSQKEPCISRIRRKLDPDNLEASLDKFELTERGYKLEEFKRGFIEALKFERKELIEDRPKNNQTPTKYNPHLRNLRKPLIKGWDKMNNSHLQQLFSKTPTAAFQHIRDLNEIPPENERGKQNPSPT